jgi:hypothetical protein
MAHGSEGYSEAELAEKIAKLGRSTPKATPTTSISSINFCPLYSCDVAKDVYGDATASKDAKDLAKAVLGMSAALEKLAKRNRLQGVKTVMDVMVDHGLAEETEGKYRLTPRGRAAKRSDINAVNRDIGEQFQRQCFDC